MSHKLAFVFPGQGSQKVGMLSELIKNNEQVGTLFTKASHILDYDLLEIVLTDPEEKLNQTLYTQPALLVASIALWTVWLAKGGKVPNLLAGHSLGEYTALVASEVIDFETAVALVAQRALFMQEAVEEGTGAMAAILSLSDQKVIEICQQVAEGQVVAPANFNTLGQIVIAGHVEGIDRAIALAKTSGGKAIKLPISVPSHCLLMYSAAEKMEALLMKINFNNPKIPIINNVDVALVTLGKEIKQALVRQLYNPVRWREIIEKMGAMNTTIIAECGPGKVLTGMTKRIANTIKPVALSDEKELLSLSTEELN
ncbi:MAG: [acyl-carrier-protein] S-malonyltransferase [Gammaproteobacteria bacterium RIFCSPHIGHO2_12_FULL_35_23]|nr:MAG: [acyl-carrier-protein] S-malonyltransferase [Gammaproteobacteria bacterium RIFCSPHIGHO2_12_FULL_35_23]